MQVRDLVLATQARWRSLVLVALIPVIFSCVVTLLLPRSYEATSQVFVSTAGGAKDGSGLLPGSAFTQQRVSSYAEVARSPLVLDRVIHRLELDESTGELRDQVRTEVPLDTVLIRITVSQPSAELAAAVANGVADEMVAQVTDLEELSSGESAVHLTLLQTATPPSSPASPRADLNLVLGLVTGAVAAALLTVYRPPSGPTARSRPAGRPQTSPARSG